MEREEAQGFAFPSQPEAPAPEGEPEFLLAALRPVLELQPARRVPREFPPPAAPAGPRKVSGGPAMAGPRPAQRSNGLAGGGSPENPPKGAGEICATPPPLFWSAA